ncbi:hypothetical protein H6F61_22450 [Cyanobacteria bacterium FACHB-472]|nr:hypothetical protein [Cyanobacteria bacterium FACHB-472]
MSGFIYLKGNCKVCNGARKDKDCRQSKSTGLIHCFHSEASPLDYIFRGLDKWGAGMWADKAEVEAASEQQREEWRQERKREKQRRLEAEQAQRSQLLSEPERDREIRKLLSQLNLSPRHREDLYRRGLNDEQIQAGMFRSVAKEQELETEISHRLAGVNIDGRSLNNYYSGYLCPAWNSKGQIIGWQLRLDNADDGKYRWPTSNNDKRPNGPTAHLTNGELPLTCCRPSGETQNKGLLLAEGILKPQIIAQLSGRVTLGAAGGNFTSSPLTLKAFLAELEPEIAGKPIALCPDAGAVRNKSVMRQYWTTYTLLKKLGYKVNVFWWHQVNKDYLDLDEMLAAGRGHEIQEIAWYKFRSIANDIAEDEAIIHEPTPFLKKGVVGFIRNLAKRLGFKPPEPTPPKPTSSEPNSKPNSEAKPTPPEPNPEPNSKSMDYLVYAPGCLPSPEQYIALGCPQIKFKDGQRQALWREAVKKGFRHILDLSAPGTGKSHTAGEAKPQNFGAEKLVYLAANHRNPTTLPIEKNYCDLPVRNAGMVFDKSRKTPMGRSHINWPKKGEEAITVGNCHRQGLFEVFQKKNISVEGQENPICQNCHLRGGCSFNTGEGFGFKKERHDVLEESLIRAHPNSVPNPNDALLMDNDKEDKFDLSTVGAIWDEPDSLINPIQQITVRLADLDQIMGLIEGKLPAIHKALTKVRLVLRQLLNKEIKERYYGFDDAAMRKILPHRQTNLEDIISELERELEPDLSPLNSTEEYGVDMKDLPDHVKKLLREKPTKLIEKLEKSIALNWVVPFLKVWNKEEPGALRCQYGELTIYTRDYRHVEIAEAAKFNIYLDATIHPKYLALLLDIEPEDILVIEQSVPSHNNLRIIQITGMGQLGKDRSDSLIARVDALKDELKSRHGESFKIIDWKACASDDEQNWFKDSRGSNEFETCQAMASFGIPRKNLGHLQGLYQSLTGRYISLDKKDSDLGFQIFVGTQTEAEIIQAIGRLRAERRPNEQLTYYFVGDYNLSFPDLPVEQVEAHTITPEAGDDKQQTWWILAEAIKQTAEAGKKLTQSVLAEAAGITQGRVSQLMKEIGGWKVFQKLLKSLLNSSSSATNNLSELTEMEIEMAQNYLPSLINSAPEDVADMDSAADKVKKVVEIADVFPDTFDSILAALPLRAKSTLFNLLVWLMPGEIQHQIGVVLSSP